jgi:hypothetical protein
MFSGIHAGRSFGYGQCAVWFAWTLLGNLLGGIGLALSGVAVGLRDDVKR